MSRTFAFGGLLFWLVMWMVIMLAGCDEQAAGSSAPRSVLKTDTTTFDMTVCVTNGNNSWIPLDIKARPDQKVAEILSAVAAFEVSHPDLEIISWQVEHCPDTSSTNPHVYGIWVHHRKIKLTPEATR
ncbi:MAG: hypothetical protein Q8L24_00765 [bacterium]|nr:hypothetical protein [bacterium]